MSLSTTLRLIAFQNAQEKEEQRQQSVYANNQLKLYNETTDSNRRVLKGILENADSFTSEDEFNTAAQEINNLKVGVSLFDREVDVYQDKLNSKFRKKQTLDKANQDIANLKSGKNTEGMNQIIDNLQYELQSSANNFDNETQKFYNNTLNEIKNKKDTQTILQTLGVDIDPSTPTFDFNPSMTDKEKEFYRGRFENLNVMSNVTGDYSGILEQLQSPAAQTARMEALKVETEELDPSENQLKTFQYLATNLADVNNKLNPLQGRENAGVQLSTEGRRLINVVGGISKYGSSDKNKVAFTNIDAMANDIDEALLLGMKSSPSDKDSFDREVLFNDIDFRAKNAFDPDKKQKMDIFIEANIANNFKDLSKIYSSSIDKSIQDDFTLGLKQLIELRKVVHEIKKANVFQDQYDPFKEGGNSNLKIPNQKLSDLIKD